VTSKLCFVTLCFMALCAALLASPAAAQEKGKILEEVVARVNNDVITRGDLDRARAQLDDELRQECPACTPDQITTRAAAQEKDLLRDLIDNSLMVQRAKDMDINVETDVVKRLDEIRQDNKLASMDDLERRVSESGLDYQDFKDNIRKQLFQQEVIRREVGSKIIPDHSEALKYYEEHKEDFVLPETVVLRELFVSTENKASSDVPALQKKADGLLQRVKGGEDFGELAKRFSDGSTAKQGGDLGTFKRGQLAPNLEAEVFKLQRMQVTDVMPTKTGFEILQVMEHYAAGLQPEEKVDSQIVGRLYDDKIRVGLRDYLATLRQDSYVDVKAGYEDTAAVGGTGIDEVPPTPDDEDATKKKSSKLNPFGKKKNGT
jgi:peptidyl-prolyl cis-trans isomerase SurA